MERTGLNHSARHRVIKMAKRLLKFEGLHIVALVWLSV